MSYDDDIDNTDYGDYSDNDGQATVTGGGDDGCGSCLVIIVLIILGVWYFWGGNNEDDTYKSYPEVYSNETRECIEPENPYDEGSGHYAGYEWGENGNYCSGNSDSFIEGCEMYEELEEAFVMCEDAN